MTVAHSTPVQQPGETDSTWLSPWWILFCLVPFAMYLVLRRENEDVDYAFADVDDHPRLPQEMFDRPGYSKSDAVYGEADDFFVTERLRTQPRELPVAENLPMATHLSAAGFSLSAPQAPSSQKRFKSKCDSEDESKACSCNLELFQIDTEIDDTVSQKFRFPEVNESNDEIENPHRDEVREPKKKKKRRKKRKR